VRRVLRGEAAALEMPLGSFAAELALALRPHFFALSGVAALAGAASVSRIVSMRVVAAALIAGLGWGVAQLVNDLLDRDADRVNAPDRAIAAGRLPEGPTLAFAALAGIALAVGTTFVHPRAWLLGIGASALVVTYNAAKRWPFGGNLALGALMAVAAALGAAGASREPSFAGALVRARGSLAVVAATAAWYLQSNYEKDRSGDRAAGYTTLAIVLPVRASAALRALGVIAIAWGAERAGVLPDSLSKTIMTAGALIGLGSCCGPLVRGTEASALRAYGAAVPASILAMLALAAPLLGWVGTFVLLIIALWLVWAAFRRSANP
jgi:4-hydroxybenzoate polyprenyltransferase